LRPSGERWAVPNAPNGWRTRVERWQAVPPTLRVLEATGGLERAADDALETVRRASPLGRAHDARVQSAPGLGPVCARTWR
jgi:hypothetical protein